MSEVNNFDSIQIGVASPEKIRSWSHGEVTKPETINYRTQKPEKDGLFCERIFGPTKDWECHCGKYKRIRYKGVVCDKCGVEVTRAKVRRERMGHIELAAPVSHIWYFKGVPSRISLALDMSPRDVEAVLYFIKYIVIDPGNTSFAKKQIIDDREYRDAMDNPERGSFRVGMGAEAIKELLAEIDLDKEADQLKKIIDSSTGQRKLKAVKRLDVIEAFRTGNTRPEWMILDVVPVLPPDLRPMVPIDGGRYATSDLNDLYRRVINRNNRLKKLLDLGAPDIIVRNEKRMLQEAVDSLIENGRRGKAVVGPGNRELKSLTAMLRGKQGRFRQNLLGKRVDYSGRSVIVVGPELKMYQCGIPKEMALELFKPFVIRKLIENGNCQNMKHAKRVIEKAKDVAVWDILEEVIKDHPVLLNRAPTLHRLGIQAFEPVLVEGRAIKLHPLACTAFNADFDGDQMAVHVPLSIEARAEARFLMLSTNNILKLSDGKPVVSPTQDMVIGSYYLTMIKRGGKGEGRYFRNPAEALMAYQLKQIDLQSLVNIRMTKEIDGKQYSKLVNTTVGRVIFNQAIPQDLGFADRSTPEKQLDLEVDFLVGKKQLSQIVDHCFQRKGATETSVILDKIKAQGYKYSTIGAVTTSIFDMHVPDTKAEIIKKAEEEALQIENYFKRGRLTEDERYERTVQVWKKAKEQVDNRLFDPKSEDFLGEFNPIWMMSDSGARGSKSQISQLCSMRGLVVDPSGKTIELPVKSNYREGLSVLEYFISSHGARKGMADTALKTADSGYLTRRLVDISQAIIVNEQDCGDTKGMVIRALDNESLADRIDGRYSIDEIVDPLTGEVICPKDTMITGPMAKKISDLGVVYARINGVVSISEDNKTVTVTAKDGTSQTYENSYDRPFIVRTGSEVKANTPLTKGFITEVRIRSILTCKTKHGVCAKCYGKNMGSGNPVKLGEAVGVIAAQSIGEPGTQLTMRTFHTGGVANDDDITQGLPRVEELFEARRPKRYALLSEKTGIVTVVNDAKDKPKSIIVTPEDGGEAEEYKLVYTQKPRVNTGDRVEAGDALTNGSIYPQDILRTKGVRGVQDYLIEQVQTAYRSSGVEINDKHIEVIVRQMLRNVKIENQGDTKMLPGEYYDIFAYEEENEKTLEAGGRPATAKRTLLGITKAALASDSFLSAASFQETARVLTDAAIKNKVDHLRGLKENVILGKLIPAGTGMKLYRNIVAVPQKSVDSNISEQDISGKFDVENDITDDEE